MKLCINGQDREFAELDETPALARLIELLHLKADRIAIERNGELVPRATWASIHLAQNDKLEIVQFVGGGSQSVGGPEGPSNSTKIHSE